MLTDELDESLFGKDLEGSGHKLVEVSSGSVMIVCAPAGIRTEHFLNTKRTTGWTDGVRYPAGVRNSSLLHNVKTDTGTSPASYPMGIVGILLGCKAAAA
jgi:hypothetical protein